MDQANQPGERTSDQAASHGGHDGVQHLTNHLASFLARARTAADAAHALRVHWPISLRGRVHLLGVGKASLAMMHEACAQLRLHAEVASRADALATCPPALAHDAFWAREGVRAYPCDHPLPTRRNVEAARAVRAFVQSVPAEDTLLVLLSGGASAHLALPSPDVDFDDLVRATDALQRAGATIQDLNLVRRHCEELKGGRLRALCPGRVVTLILSDVLGDTPHDIASGPTVPDPTTPSDALRVVRAYGLEQAAPSVAAHIATRAARAHVSTTFSAWHDARVIASNHLIVDELAQHTRQLGYTVARVLHNVEGSAQEVARTLADLHTWCAQHAASPWAIIAGGEPTVDVRTASGAPDATSPGIGGPSQEVCVALMHLLRDYPSTADWAALAYSTDGRDGPTESAGGVVSRALARRVSADALRDTLIRHDSSTLLRREGAAIPRSETSTNLNHVWVLLGSAAT